MLEGRQTVEVVTPEFRLDALIFEFEPYEAPGAGAYGKGRAVAQAYGPYDFAVAGQQPRTSFLVGTVARIGKYVAYEFTLAGTAPRRRG